ncbi:MAG: hypothetical protein ACKVOI_10760, partial [Dongiaceae bacterium]
MSQPPKEASLLPGDPVPALPLKGPGGEPVNLWDQSLAGRTALLWFSGSAMSIETRQELSRHLAELAALETLVYEVALPGAEVPEPSLLERANDAGGAALLLGISPPG